MNETNEEKWLDDLISQSINSGKPQFDAEKWNQKYPEEFEILKSRAARSPAARPNIWRIIMETRITKLAAGAAIVAMVTALLYLGLTAGPATAAEKLEEIIKVNEDYKGWLHITTTCEPTMQGVPNEEHLSKGISHMNTVDGTLIILVETDHELKIQYYSPADEEYIEYTSLKEKVDIYDLDSFPAKQLVESYPLTMDAIMASFRKVTGKEPYEITLVEEGDYERFDVRLFENEEEAIRASEEFSAVFPASATLWVNADTKLIHKIRSDMQDQSLLLLITYGEPIINDIYDLGVPREAKVIDNRITTGLEAVLDRLENRIAGLDHYVALMTETLLTDNGTYDAQMCALHLFAEDGVACLTNRYLVGVNCYSNGRPRPSVMETPESWPSVEMEAMLEKIKHKLPCEFRVHDGEDFHSDVCVLPKDIKDKSTIKSLIDRYRAQMGLGIRIWFGNRGRHGPGTKMKLITRDHESSEIGLKIEFFVHLRASERQRVENIYWFDAARDDVPTEKLFRDYAKDGTTVKLEFHTLYFEYSQLPDGRWYPTRWQTTTVSNPQSGRLRRFIREYHLYIYPDMELDKDWFTHPLDRLEK